ncbi:desiccation-related protein PCC13-62-like [Nymphaea colorata]|nr:desiccation-related protein PCC13-62-like [Nymphaea colorata]
MASSFFYHLLAFIPFLLLVSFSTSQASSLNLSCASEPPATEMLVFPSDVPLLEFPLNLEHLEADFFLYGALGRGLDELAPELVMGGPPPVGARKANLDPLTRDIILQFGYQEIGHLRAIKETIRWFPRPLLDLSPSNFARVMDDAFGFQLSPPFDPYANSINFLLATYVIPYVGLTGYVGTNPNLKGHYSKRLVAGLLGVESGQDAVDRGLLYERKQQQVEPYNMTVEDFTDRISILRDRLGGCGVKDEGLTVPRELGAEGRIRGNILSGDMHSLSYARTPAEILRIVYGTGSERVPGGFFPKGGNGKIARSYLQHH